MKNELVNYQNFDIVQRNEKKIKPRAVVPKMPQPATKVTKEILDAIRATQIPQDDYADEDDYSNSED